MMERVDLTPLLRVPDACPVCGGPVRSEPVSVAGRTEPIGTRWSCLNGCDPRDAPDAEEIVKPVELPPTPRLQAVLHRAARLAHDQGLNALTVEHVVLAALEDERSVPAQVFGQRADSAVLRADLERVMRSPEYRANL